MYRCPKGRILQNSLSIPIGLFLFCYWTVAVVTVLVPVWRKTDWDAYFTVMSQYRMPQYRIPIPYLPATMTVFLRMIWFFIFGVSQLEAVAIRVCHEYISKSFDFVPMSELTKEATTRLFEELLYQYQPLWLILILLCLSGYNIAALVPRANDKELPPEFGMVLLLETGLRVALKVIWRYLHLDTEGIQALKYCILRRSAKKMIRLPSVTKLTGFSFQIGYIRAQPSLPSFLRFPRAGRNMTDEKYALC
jgi:hypothetical protein